MADKMKITEKLQYIQEHHFSDWLTTCSKVKEELSDKQSVFCLCGRLATELHESNCKKFKDVVIKETLRRLNYLLPTHTKR